MEVSDVTRLTKEYVRDLVPQAQNGRVRVGLAGDVKLLEEAFRGVRGRDLQQRQAADKPRVILIEGGVLTLDQVVSQLDDERIAKNQGGVVTVGLPLLITPGAALIVDGKVTSRMLLSTDRGAFLANAGRLFVIDAFVTSWSGVLSGPSVFVAKEQFRPFIASYIRSETYVAGSTIQHLGFAAPTAYGFSLSSHPERNRGDPRKDWPTGILVGNEFRGLYYGFYSFEARDVAIVDNQYVDSVVYGIDPHDRSTRLVIARNSATGTIQRHGIIGSREITHSFIVDNVCYNNTGSGIMLDRQCRHNLVSGNTVYSNGQGIAVYESPNNVIQENVIAFNTKSGLRIRNSADIRAFDNTIVGHDDYALEAYAKQLDDHDKRVARGDMYEVGVGVSFFRNSVKHNRGIAKGTNMGILRLGAVRQDVDVVAIAKRLNIASPIALHEEDASFGHELKALAPQLRRVINSESLMVEVRGDEP